MGGLSGLHDLGNEEELEGECDIGIPAHEADVLRRDHCAFFNVYYIINLKERPPTPVNK